MKKILSLAACALLALLSVSCEPDIFDPTDPYGENDTTVPITDGNTFTYGTHNYVLRLSDKQGSVTFTHFPSNLREFKFLQNQLLGTSKPGVLALELMAMEMYRRNRNAGTAALELCNVSSNMKPLLGQLSQRFPLDRSATVEPSHQPYLIASFLDGATPENKYTPEYPYVLSFYENPSPYVKQGEYSLSFFGNVYNWCITRYGEKETEASMVLISDETLYLVTACSDYVKPAIEVSGWEDDLL